MQLDGAVTTVLLMRHGETAWNRQRRIMGDLDIPLNETGRQQCIEAAGLLADFGIDRIVTSPLARAVETADIVASKLGVGVVSDERLVEIRFGEWQGGTYEEIAADPRYRAFACDPCGQATPGGETIACVQKRGLESLASLRAGECVLVVTHGDLIRSLLSYFLDTPLRQYRRVRTDNCGISAVAFGRGTAEVKFVNVLADQARARSLMHWSGRP